MQSFGGNCYFMEKKIKNTGTARFSCQLRKSGVKIIEWQEYRTVLRKCSIFETYF
jgi:hypothetical protein